MFRKLISTFILLMCFSLPAQANRTIFSANSIAVSTSSVEVLPASTARRYLLIQNVCASNIGISITGTTAVIGTAGTITLFPGGSLEFSGKDVPDNAINAISASGSCGVTIWEIN